MHLADSAPLRVALFGHGHMGRLHAQKVLGMGAGGSREIVLFIVDPAQGLSAVPPDIDAAIIASPTSTHDPRAPKLRQMRHIYIYVNVCMYVSYVCMYFCLYVCMYVCM